MDRETGSGTSSTQGVHYDQSRDVAVEGDVVASSRQYAGDLQAEMGLSAQDDFRVTSVTTGLDGRYHTRLEQTHKGIPVWGSGVVVHASDFEVNSMRGNVVTGLASVETTPELPADRALSIAESDYASAASSADELRYDRESTELVVLSGRGGTRLAWHAEFFTELQAGLEPGLWNYLIDAKTGEVLSSFNAIHTISQASGPGGNPKVDRYWDEALDVESAEGEYEMETPLLQTVDMENKRWGSGTVPAGSLDDIGDRALNDAHGFAEVTLDMLDEWMGMNSIDDDGYQIRSRVHYGSNYENAFWDGQQMTYGDGDEYFYPLSGDIDVVSHEVHHGFTTFHSNLVYRNRSGGLNESFSDIAAVAAEFFHNTDRADFDIGEDVFQEEGAALRYMCDPPADGDSIDHADDFSRGMDVHYSSGVSNKAFCLAAKRLSGAEPEGEATREGVKRAARAWFEANKSYWTRSTNFTQGCQGVVDAASAMGYSAAELDALATSWADVGVHCEAEVENEAPEVSITAPEEGATLSGQAEISADASDADGSVERVEFELPEGSTVQDTSAPYEASWDTTSVEDGEDYVVRAVAYDDEGASSEKAARSVAVANRSGTGWSASAAPELATEDAGEVCTSLEVSEEGDAADVRVDLSGRHDWRSALRATLEHEGTLAAVFESGALPSDAGPFSLEDEPVSGFEGSAQGTWTLCITDTDGYGDTGVLETWGVHD